MLQFSSYYSLWLNCTGHCITLSPQIPADQLLMFILHTSVEYAMPENILDIIYYFFLEEV